MSFNIGKTYNFTTLAPDVLGGEYRAMKVISMMTATEAVKYRDIYTLHSSLIDHIPNLPTDANDCVFVLFENQDKIKIVLALEYIDINSIELVETTNIEIKLFNTNTDDLAIIRSRLLELGYTNFTIKTF